MDNQKIKNDSNNTIGKNIRKLRQNMGIGQTELVGQLQLLDIKMTRETLVKIERGVQHIQLEQLKGIKKVLGVSYEELDTDIRVGEIIDTIEYDYPTFHLSMDCFWAEIVSGDLVLKEHEAAKWLTKEELDSVEWLPADVALIDKIKNIM